MLTGCNGRKEHLCSSCLVFWNIKLRQIESDWVVIPFDLMYCIVRCWRRILQMIDLGILLRVLIRTGPCRISMGLFANQLVPQMFSISEMVSRCHWIGCESRVRSSSSCLWWIRCRPSIFGRSLYPGWMKIRKFDRKAAILWCVSYFQPFYHVTRKWSEECSRFAGLLCDLVQIFPVQRYRWSSLGFAWNRPSRFHKENDRRPLHDGTECEPSGNSHPRINGRLTTINSRNSAANRKVQRFRCPFLREDWKSSEVPKSGKWTERGHLWLEYVAQKIRSLLTYRFYFRLILMVLRPFQCRSELILKPQKWIKFHEYLCELQRCWCIFIWCNKLWLSKQYNKVKMIRAVDSPSTVRQFPGELKHSSQNRHSNRCL